MPEARHPAEKVIDIAVTLERFLTDRIDAGDVCRALPGIFGDKNGDTIAEQNTYIGRLLAALKDGELSASAVTATIARMSGIQADETDAGALFVRDRLQVVHTLKRDR